MIKIEKTDVYGFETAIRGMRNPMNSWGRSDSYPTGFFLDEEDFNNCKEEGIISKFAVYKSDLIFSQKYIIGDNDLKLMKQLRKAGSDHSKYLRMINVSVDVVAPLYWWKEFDTYKVGTVANSCSTMHKIHDKEFEFSDFSHEKLLSTGWANDDNEILLPPLRLFERTIEMLNECRTAYLKETDADVKKLYWWQMIQILPSSYNQRRTVQLNYAVLLNMYYARKNHKLDEWHIFCDWIENLPYFKEICLN